MLNRGKTTTTSSVKVERISRILFTSNSTGLIAWAMRDAEGRLSSYLVEDYPFKQKKRTEVFNMLCEINGICGELKDETEYPGKYVIALPEQVYNIVTNLEILMSQFMYDVTFVRRETEEATHPEIPEIKSWVTKDFTHEEKDTVKTYLENFLELSGKIAFCNARYIGAKNEAWQGTKALATKLIQSVED